MKRILSGILAGLLVLSGCSAPQAKTEHALSIVVTIFPEYDWVNAILGDNPGGAEVTILTENGADLHSYQPTAKDMVTIADSDLFVYVGGESDRWVADALKESNNPKQTVVALLEVLGDAVKEEEAVEGMEAEAEEAEEEEGPEYDEHVWLSLRNAKVLVEALYGAIAAADPDHAETYRANTDAYLAQLDELDGQYQETRDTAEYDTLIFGDRFPFRYLVDDYQLNYYAAFKGCSAETEASFETILFLAGKMDELGLPHIMKIEGSDGKIAATILKNTAASGQDILTLNSMQGITSADIRNGASYLQIMKDNLEVLKQALH
jgi:zinc transport system substrate-binding protein